MKKIIALSLVLFLASSLQAGGSPVGSGFSLSKIFPFSLFATGAAPAESQIPFDSNVERFTLANGLTCYIAKNKKPEKRASLRLVIKAGSLNEDDDQSGVAHLVEHLAFTGSAHFRKNELISSLEALGVQYGPELNAATSYESTTYILDIPTDDEKALDTAFLILEDWAHALSLDSEQIDRERMVIKEEWRQRQNAQSELSRKTMRFLLENTRYAQREPIGDMEKLFAAPHGRIRDFYKKWYTPERMALIAVGDFDTAMIRKKIEQHFSFSAAEGTRGDALPRAEKYSAPSSRVITDRELTSARVSLFNTMSAAPLASEDDFTARLIEGLCFSMISERLSAAAQVSGAPFTSASAGSFSVNGNIRFSIAAANLSSKEMTAQALTALENARRQAALYGFSESELERQKKEYLSYFDNLYAERDNRLHESLVEELEAHFLEGEAVPGFEWEYRFYSRVLPALTSAQVNESAKKIFSDNACRIIVSGPENPLSEKEILDAYTRAGSLALAPYEEQIDSRPLIGTPPAKGSVIKEEFISESGIYIWTLSNGARVVIKPTDFKNDEILMYAFSPGGTSLVSDEQFVAAATAVMIASESGSGEFDKTALRKKLAGKNVSFSRFIDSEYEGFQGNSSGADLETLLSLQYLAFTNQRFDEGAFAVAANKLGARLREIENDPETLYENRVRSILMGGNSRANLYSAATLQKLDLALSRRIYAERFSNARDFTWVFTGSVDIPRLKELAAAYIASLPSQDSKEKWRDLGIRPPQGNLKEAVKKGTGERCRVSIYLTTPQKWSRNGEYLFRTAGAILESRLDKSLREAMGGVYSANAGGFLEAQPYPRSMLYISFSCDPKRADELYRAALRELASLASDGPRPDEIAVQREQFKRRIEVQLKDNDFWHSYIVNSLMNDQTLLYPFSMEDFEKTITAESVRSACRSFTEAESQIRVDLIPE